MQILLIKAERLSETERWVAKPLGILYLAEIARRAGHDVEVLDLRIMSGPEAKSRLNAALNKSPDLVGLSALSHQAAFVRRLADFIRRKRPNVFLVAGGPLATANTEYVLENTAADACLMGEGERVFQKLLEAFSKGSDWHGLAGIAFRRDDENILNPPADLIEDLDSLPTPAWDLVDFDAYGRYLSMSLRLGRIASIHTSRGCPYGCIYCQHYFGSQYRARSPENVLAEVNLLYGHYGIRRIEIIDDCFNLDRERANRILEALRDDYPQLRISFPNAVRGDLLDEPFIRLLKEARCEFMPIALESGSKRIQKMIRKNLNLEKIREAARCLDRYRIPSLACFMVGFPGETHEEMEETFAMAEEFKGLMPVFSIVTPYPRTKLWDLAQPEGELANPENLDSGYGSRFADEHVVALVERALKLSRTAVFKARYWFIFGSELRWRLIYQWRVLPFKLLSFIVPIRFRRSLVERINREFDLDLSNQPE